MEDVNTETMISLPKVKRVLKAVIDGLEGLSEKDALKRLNER